MAVRSERSSEQVLRPRRRRRKRRRSLVPLLLTAAVTAFGLWKLTIELADKYQSKRYLEEMAEQVVEEITQPFSAETQESRQEEPVEVAPIQVDFRELMLYYPDITAWLYCPGTSINYPVMQTDNNQYYVHRLPNGKESAGGSLFVDCTNTWGFSDSNTVIYGHDMKDGTMFGYLHNFEDQSYYEDHSVIYLLTPGCNYRMDIFCAAVVPSDSWIYQKQMDAEQLQTWITDAGYSSSIRPLTQVHYEAERFLTLSTCSYEYEGARFVVIGSLKKIY